MRALRCFFLSEVLNDTGLFCSITHPQRLKARFALLLLQYEAFSLYSSWPDLCLLALASSLYHLHLSGWIDVG